MRLLVNNFKGCKSAEIEVGGMTILSGQCRAGKTSIGRAFQIAACQIPKFRGQKETYAHIGGKSSKIELTTEKYNFLVKYPKGEASGSGQKLSDDYVTGLSDFLELSADSRRAYLIDATKSVATSEDFRKFLSSAVPDKTVDSLYEKVQINGFDAMLDSANEKGKEKKYDWKRATGTQFPTRGHKAADEWIAANKSYASAPCQKKEIIKLDEIKLSLIKNDAISESEIAKLKSELELKWKYEKSLEDAEKILYGLKKEYDVMTAKLGQYKKLKCSSCGIDNYIDLPKDVDTRFKGLSGEIYQTENEIREIYRRLKNCEEIEEKLKKVSVAESGIEEKIKEINSRINELTEIENNRERYLEALKIYEVLIVNLEIQEALKPSGIRNICLMRGIDIFNACLDFVSTEIGIDKVSIDEDMIFHCGYRTEYDLSTSEKWALRHTIQLSLCRLNTSPQCVFLDEVGSMDSILRTGIIKLVKKMTKDGHNIMMAITHYDRGVCDVFISHKLMPPYGSNVVNHYWIESGVVK